MASELKPCPFCSKTMMLRSALWPSEGDADAIIHADPTDCPMLGFSDGSADGSIIEKWNCSLSNEDDFPSDGSCVRCGSVPRNANGLCNTCLDEDAERLENTRPTPVAPVSPQGIVISNRFYEHLIALTGYHITRPPTPDHEFVNVCNGDLRKLSDFMDTVAPVSPDATGKCGELVTVGEVSTVRESIAAFAGHMLSRQLKPGDLLCLRSQAVELLAAKDTHLREINELLDAGQGDDDGAQILPDFEEGMTVLGKVEACLVLLEDRRDVIEALEAKLAAAEKALTVADEALQADAIASAHAAIRAALGGKPA